MVRRTVFAFSVVALLGWMAAGLPPAGAQPLVSGQPLMSGQPLAGGQQAGAGLGAPAPKGSSGAQQTAGPVLRTEKAAGKQVEIPVVVRDKKGALVTDLNKSQLTLTQDGRAQTIESLTRSDEPMQVGILIDTTRGMSAAMDAQRKAAGSFIDALLPDGTKNEAFLIHFDTQVELLEDFTSARDKLHSELDDMGSTSASKRDSREGPETVDNPNESNPRHRNDDQLYDAIYLASNELMKGKSGRKALVIFSNGADRGSKETLNDAIDAAEHSGLTIYTIFFKGEQQKEFGKDNFPRQRGGMGNPGGYPGGGYPGGGYPGGNPGGYPGGGNPGGGRKQPEPTTASGVDGKRIMLQIATRTGGHAYEARHTADLDPIYKLIGEEMHAQYLLTYTPDKPDTEGDFHKIVVTVNEKDWTVAAPEGYYPKGSGDDR